MQEDFLHYIWKHKKFDTSQLITTGNELIDIVHLGQPNFNAGPDFFNAQIRIEDQLWAGNVEIHINSSDWYVHKHEMDSAYDNVILHVVWEHDVEIFRKDNTAIPTLELKKMADNNVIYNYQNLIRSKSWINCELQFPAVHDFLLNNWLDRLYIQRLERKSIFLNELLEKSNNDWEAVLFKMLFRNFGLKINAESFNSIANSLDFSIVRKLQHNISDLEALLYGQGRLLETHVENQYYLDLKENYNFLKNKFCLDNSNVVKPNFFRLRPLNFPTIRLSQLSNLYASRRALFSEVINCSEVDGFYNLFNIGVSEFWKSHYTFSSSSKSSNKKLSKSFIDLILINTIIPIKFGYARANGQSIEEELLHLLQNLKLESNAIVNRFLGMKDFNKNAMVSQSLLELKHEYCDKNRCIHCEIGNSLIIKN